MTEVKVLISGSVGNKGVIPTTTLITDGHNKIIVDPGMGKNKKKVLQKALQKEGLTFNDINIVFCTHYHLDHTMFVGLFPKAKIFDYQYFYNENIWGNHKGNGYKISKNVSIMHTPGHQAEHASLLVRTEKGIIAVGGDIFWFSDMRPKKDDMAANQKVLEKSRKKLLNVADYIIPGHGKMFKVKK